MACATWGQQLEAARSKIAEWIANVERLAKIAVTEPQAASAFIQRLQSLELFLTLGARIRQAQQIWLEG